MGYGSYIRDAGWHERHTRSRCGDLPIMPWTRLEGPAFTAGLGDGNPHAGHGGYYPPVLPRLRRLQTSGEPVTANLAEPDAERLAVAQLRTLSADLAGRGFLAVRLTDDGTPTLQVTNRDTGCSENITIKADDNGAWWFMWSWGDRLGEVGDVDAAAFKIAYVLTPQAGS